jgi:hypothetical protein
LITGFRRQANAKYRPVKFFQTGLGYFGAILYYCHQINFHFNQNYGRMRKTIFAGMMVIVLVSMPSCQKTDESNSDTAAATESNLKAAVTEVVSNSVDETSTQDVQSLCVEKYDGFGEAIRIGNGFIEGLGHRKFRMPHLSDCATVTVSDSAYPLEIVIDYGSGCTDHHKHTLSGKIVIRISDSLTHEGAVRTVTSQDLYIDSAKVEISARFENLGINADGNWVIQSSSDLIVALDDSTIVNREGKYSTEWISGFNTTDKDDDIFYKSGLGTIIVNDTLAYSYTITTPLLYDRSCKYILSGAVELYKDGNTIVIDYGDGTCDNTATVTTNGTTEEVNLDSHEYCGHGEKGKHHHHHGN